MENRSTFAIVAFLLIAGLAAYLTLSTGRSTRPATGPGAADVSVQPDDSPDARASSAGDRTGAALNNAVVGETQDAAGAANEKHAEDPEIPSHLNYGRAEGVKATASPQAASAYEALKTGKHPERLSVFVPPKPFNKEKFEQDPQSYLNVNEPGRVYQTAQPAKGVGVLKPVGGRLHRIKQGDEVKLKVRSAPKAPVTFTSFDMGTFKESKLNSVTVRADKLGLAETTFVGTKGTLNDVRILAGSPMTTGQVKFTVLVENSDGPKAVR